MRSATTRRAASPPAIRGTGGATMRCPKCGTQSKVLETRRREEHTIRRYRECLGKKCGLRFFTCENVTGE